MVWAASTVVALGAAGVGLASAAYGAHQAGKAADQQAEGTSRALDETARQYDLARADDAPYRAAGTTALGQFAAENDTPLDVSHLQMDPGYQFGLTEGQKAIDRKTSAAGGRISGAALKEAAQYGTNYAATGYDAAYGRANQARSDRLARLASLANIGQIATNSGTAAGISTTNARNALTVAAGNNAGAASLAQGNIWGNAGNQLAALYGRSSTPPPSSARVTEGATNQTANFDYYGTGYSP